MADEVVETKSYDEDIRADVASAIAEVSKPAEPVEAKPEPAEVKTETKSERARDESGKFVKADDKPIETKSDKEVVLDSGKSVPQPDKTLPASATSGEQPAPAKTAPPPGWSIKSKSEWDKLPQHIREDVLKRETEVSDGFSQYSGLKPFAERAKQNGQSLTQALQAYTGIEDLIRRDIEGGMLHIASNTGLTQYQAGQLFANLAQRLGFQTPTNGQAANGHIPADQNAELRQLIEPLLDPFAQKIAQLEGTFRQQTEAVQGQRLASANNVIEQFRQNPAHRYYDNLEETIGDLLEGGVVKRTGDLAADLAKAYDLACWQHPEIRESLISERSVKSVEDKQAADRAAAEKARNAAKSITGSPSVGANEPGRKRDPSKSYQEDLMEDVRNAVQSSYARA